MMDMPTNKIPTVFALITMVVPVFSMTSQAVEPTEGPGVLAAEIMEALKTLESRHNHQDYEQKSIFCYLNNPTARIYYAR